METLELEVQADFVETLSRTKPLSAIAELIWNALDADAKNVRVEIDFNSMTGVEAVRVVDDGLGMTHEEAKKGFGRLGGSWKRTASRTKQGRLLHGKEGKGRFRAFALGKKVTWSTVFRAEDGLKHFRVFASLLEPRKSVVGTPEPCEDVSTGTVVEIREPDLPLGTLLTEKAEEFLAEHFALRLTLYTDVALMYRGNPIEPSALQNHRESYDFTHQVDGRNAPDQFKLTVIEWKSHARRALLLCDEDGFTLHETKPGIHAPGYQFTGYLCSPYFKELEEQGLLDVEDLAPGLEKILNTTKVKLREHFRKREAAQAVSLIDEWKQEDVYPYTGDPADPLETAERQVFDVLAINVHNYLPDFEDIEQKSKRFALRLLRHALETRPSTMVRILTDVLNLPSEKQEEFVALLEKTSLEAIITASKVVTDRLDFLRGFNSFLFDLESKKAVLERQQLQQVLANEPWIFGEKYNLTQQEATLTEVLRRHYDLLGIDEEVTEEVIRYDGSPGRVDLMFGAVTEFEPGKREHLVVELKRPSIKIDSKALSQVQSYAEAVASDSRFFDTDTTWHFFVISNDLHPHVRTQANQPGRASGLAVEYSERPIKIWAKTWGQVIQECEARLQFVKKQLEYEPTHKAGLDYIRNAHANYLPDALKENPEAGETGGNESGGTETETIVDEATAEEAAV